MKDRIKRMLPWMLVLVLVLCAVAFVKPAEAYAEKGREIRTEQVSEKDRKGDAVNVNKYASAGIKAGTGSIVPTHFAITYDATKVFPTTRLSGYDVTLLLQKYITSNPGNSLDGNGWFVYDAYGPTEGYVSYTTNLYTSLVKKISNNGDNDDFVSLYDSDEKLDPNGEYYFRFNIENWDYSDGDFLFDVEATYTATVNAQSADFIYWRDQSSDGDLYVYKRVSLNETANTILAIDIEPYDVRVQRGNAFQFNVIYYAATSEGVTWDVSQASSAGTRIDSTGRLYVPSDETSSTLRVTATCAYDDSVYEYAYVELIDEPVKIDSVTMRDPVITAYIGDNIRVYAIVEGTDFHNLDWTVSGNASSGTDIADWGAAYIDGTEYMSAWLSINKQETASQIVVEARSAQDPTKYDTCIVNLRGPGEITNPVSITYKDNTMYLSENKTEAQVNQEFLNSITSPFGDGWDRPIDNQWYIYGDKNGDSNWTGLVKKVGEGTEFEDFVPANSETEMISSDEEYYLWFNVYCDPTYYYFDFDKDLSYYNVTVNGIPADGENIIAFWGDDIEVYVKIDVQTDPTVFATLKAANLTLEGKITINFKVAAPGDGYKARFYYEKNGYGMVSEVPMNSSNWNSDSSGGYYLVSYDQIPAKEMTQTLRIKVFDKNGNQIKLKTSKGYFDEYDYSVATWCNNKIDQSSDADDVMIAMALLNYGHYTQLALKYNDGLDGRPNKLANPEGYLYYEMVYFYEENSAYDSVTTGGPSLGAKAFALVLESDTSIKLKLNRQVSVAIDGVTVTPAQETDNGATIWAVYKNGIPAKKLHEHSAFTLTEGSNSVTLQYGALSWANKKLTGDDVNDKNLAKAMYLYNYAARKYFHYDEAGL